MTRVAVLLLAGYLSLCGCGIPRDGAPRVVASLPSDLGQTPSPPASGSRQTATIFLVDEGRLVAVQRPLSSPIGVAALISSISAGPTPSEQARGLRTALSSRLDLRAATVDRSGHLTIELEHEPAGVGAAEQVLAFGQVVLSLITLPSIRSVQFRVDNQPLAVPRGDGSLSTSPLAQDDYAELQAGRTPS